MTPQVRSSTSYWWALGIVGTFAVVLVILLLAGVLGSTVWWTAAAMILLAISPWQSPPAAVSRVR